MTAFFVWYAICGVMIAGVMRLDEGVPYPIWAHIAQALTWPIWFIAISVRLGAWCTEKFYKFLKIEI